MRTWSEDQLKQAVATSTTLTDCVRALGLSVGGAARKSITRQVEKFGLDTSHWLGKRKPHKPDQIVLVKGSEYRNLSGLKTRLLNAGHLEYRCYRCGLIEWMNEPITLQIHHRNGISNDNRLVNLELLCLTVIHKPTITPVATSSGLRHRRTSLVNNPPLVQLS
jgi:hypothetical protein